MNIVTYLYFLAPCAGVIHSLPGGIIEKLLGQTSLGKTLGSASNNAVLKTILSLGRGEAFSMDKLLNLLNDEDAASIESITYGLSGSSKNTGPSKNTYLSKIK